MQVDYKLYKEQFFGCPKCGWYGKGDELVNGDFHENSCIGDLECPNSFHLVAFWQGNVI